MNRLESMPSEARYTSSVPISLDTDQRLNLLHELRSLSDELQEDPFVRPAKATTELKGIQLRAQTENAPASYMGLSINSADNEPVSASISLTGNRLAEKEHRLYVHRPAFNVWEDWRPGASEPHSIVDNAALLTTLEPLLPIRSLESMMDTSVDDIDVAQVLASHLQKKARTHTERAHYLAHGIEVGSAENTRDTDFIVATNNNRTNYNLFVAASFMLDGFGDIRKTYQYEAVDVNGSLKSTSGSLSVSAGSIVPTPRRNAFAHRDLIRNDPSYAIVTGTKDIRAAYKTSHEL